MFQSDKGIWLLDRGLGTEYTGAPVEDLVTGNTVTSAVNVPETNQVRFTLSSGVILMYDYYYSQWGSFTVSAVSSCIWNGMHALIDSSGNAYEETPGTYIDGASTPVLMSYETGPLRLGDIQAYQRAYFFFLIGQYLSPHTLTFTINYNQYGIPNQVTTVIPEGVNPELSRVFLNYMRSQYINISMQENYTGTYGAALTLSGLNVVCGFKRPFRTQSAGNSFG
jgi:hypothetical protein